MAKPAICPIEGERIGLRLLAEADLPMTLNWRNQDQIRRWFKSSDPISPELHRSWFANYRHRDDDFVFIIEEHISLPRPVGQIALYHIDYSDKKAEFGRLMIGETGARGKGLAREATQLLLTVAFRHFKLDEVYLEVFENNTRAIAIYRQCGFQIYGRTDDLMMMNIFFQDVR